MDLVHLWLHESSRVYSDKLMEEKDVELFNKILLDTGKRFFEVVDVVTNKLLWLFLLDIQHSFNTFLYYYTFF